VNKKDIIKAVLVLAILALVGVAYYKHMTREDVPAENMFRLANKHLEDGKYQDALDEFNKTISENPTYADAFMGRGITLMQLERFDESRKDFDKAIELNEKLAPAYADRGVLNDRTGRYEEALKDYRKALELNPDLAEGPGWFWRFLRNIPEKPPTIADRARYLEEELKKPEKERLLRVPEIDSQQKMYKK